MKPVMEMTLDECRDWLAIEDSWQLRNGRWYHAVWHREGSGQKRHPIPATLDAVAAAMPPDWTFSMKLFATGGCEILAFRILAFGGFNGHDLGVYGESELLARFRLAVACRRASAMIAPRTL